MKLQHQAEGYLELGLPQQALQVRAVAGGAEAQLPDVQSEPSGRIKSTPPGLELTRTGPLLWFMETTTAGGRWVRGRITRKPTPMTTTATQQAPANRQCRRVAGSFNRRDAKRAEIRPRCSSPRSSRLCGSSSRPVCVEAPPLCGKGYPDCSRPNQRANREGRGSNRRRANSRKRVRNCHQAVSPKTRSAASPSPSHKAR